ncbi:MAG TPA: non-canonical purine NTP pyrophosphatase [Firmicutes bacterium]|nr:non-canonical purine NTP pyrophosphatase [Bacillota bacterium]
MRRLVLATRNRGKIVELQEMLADLPLEIVGVASYPEAPEVAETGKTFRDNAYLKAKAIADFTHEMTLADDSGLEVDYLKGEPGVYSARYGEIGWNDQQRYEYLLSKLNNVPENLRKARFRSVVVVYDPGTGQSEFTEGSVEGVILTEPRGSNGFGYDPVFYFPEYQKTMAELPAVQKNALSHRGWAIQKMVPQLQKLI